MFKIVDTDSNKNVNDDYVGEKHENQEENSQEGWTWVLWLKVCALNGWKVVHCIEPILSWCNQKDVKKGITKVWGIHILFNPIASVVKTVNFCSDLLAIIIVKTLPHFIFVDTDDDVGEEAIKNADGKKKVKYFRNKLSESFDSDSHTLAFLTP